MEINLEAIKNSDCVLNEESCAYFLRKYIWRDT